MIRLLRGSTNSPGRDVCFATLPYHIQLRITSWLSLSELANAARLSSQWSQLARAASQLVRMAVPADANVASGPLEETPVHAICRLNGAQKHILVLDLDETLVRVQPLSLGQQAASMKQAPPAVKTRPGSRAKRATLRLGRRLSQLQPHHVRGTRRFIVHAGTGDAKQKLEVSVRPHVPVLLNYLRRSGAWHVIVWTAAEKSYADAVLDGLEGNARVLTRRLYQQHCAIGPTGFIKDLRHLGCPLSRTLLVDNSPVTYAAQPESAVPISSWLGDASDRAILELIALLRQASTLQDVRPLLHDRFRLCDIIADCHQRMVTARAEAGTAAHRAGEAKPRRRRSPQVEADLQMLRQLRECDLAQHP
mmetsp:Transcript_20985/g.40838  ORF Transcript_20985/g.40838 Transcript_20985/m.40838 type:complete len:363 (-) Transcript_20985:267-1355(-)